MNETDLNVNPSPGGHVPPPRQPDRDPVQLVFFGPNGLRAGWRLLIYVVLMALFGLAVVVAIGPLVQRYHPPGVLTGEGSGFLAALGASLVMGYLIEHRTLGDYGLPIREAFGLRFWTGLLWGFLALTALLILIHLGHGFDFGAPALQGGGIAKYAALWGISFLVVGFAEEYVFRGYALATLASGMRFWPAAILLSAAFGAGHLGNPGEDWTGALCAGLIGLFFCFTLRRTGSLWFAIGLHAAWDFSESFLYSAPDSGAMVPGHLLNSSFHGPRWLTGGSVGPEGSALVFPIIAVLFLLFNHFYKDVLFPRPAAERPISKTLTNLRVPEP